MVAWSIVCQHTCPVCLIRDKYDIRIFSIPWNVEDVIESFDVIEVELSSF